MKVKVTVDVVTDDSATNATHEIVLSETALNKVLFDFNVTGDKRVQALKALSAAGIQMMLEHQAAADMEAGGSVEIRKARGRAAAIAITEAELTQMVMVKALFAKA